MLPDANAPTTVSGMMWSRKSTGPASFPGVA